MHYGSLSSQIYLCICRMDTQSCFKSTYISIVSDKTCYEKSSYSQAKLLRILSRYGRKPQYYISGFFHRVCRSRSGTTSFSISCLCYRVLEGLQRTFWYLIKIFDFKPHFGCISLQIVNELHLRSFQTNSKLRKLVFGKKVIQWVAKLEPKKNGVRPA